MIRDASSGRRRPLRLDAPQARADNPRVRRPPRDRRATLRFLGTLALASLTGCNPSEPSLRGVRLWEGEADCATCQAGAIDLTAYAEPRISLRRDRTYTVELTLSPGEHPDRCIYKFTWQTWRYDYLPREFKCSPVEQTMRSTFPTQRDPGAPRTETDRFGVAVNVYEVSTRSTVATLFERAYEVDWR